VGMDVTAHFGYCRGVAQDRSYATHHVHGRSGCAS
jgi:hypothetical protein